jgi:hypothetical protein
MEQRRQLGLAATIAVVTGESIALGIFLTPAAMAKSLGSPLLLTAVWCGMGLIAMCGALCYSELAVRFPRAGGEYPPLAMTARVTCYLIGQFDDIPGDGAREFSQQSATAAVAFRILDKLLARLISHQFGAAKGPLS